jgi:predicted DNA-binding ArsR family transcriptional regulator
MIRTGFIAQEVEQAAKKSGYTFDGLKAPKTEREYYSLSYSSFVVPLVKAVQEQQEIIQAQDLRISNLEQEIAEIKKLVQVSH